MIELQIPGFGEFSIEHLVLDVNGTIATDGILLAGVHERLNILRTQVQVHLLTADTHGKQAEIDAQLSLHAQIIVRGGVQKADTVRRLNADSVVAVGNGANDADMCRAAAIGIAVLGAEGAAAALLQSADVVTRDINDALDLLIYPNRIRSTLRR